MFSEFHWNTKLTNLFHLKLSQGICYAIKTLLTSNFAVKYLDIKIKRSLFTPVLSYGMS